MFGLSTLKLAGIGIGVILAGILIWQFFAYLSRENKREEEQIFNAGVVTERSQAVEESLNVVENANRPITDAERNVVCSRYDRNCPTKGD